MKTKTSFSIFLVLAAFEFVALMYTMNADYYGSLFFVGAFVGLVANVVAMKVAQRDGYDVTAPMIGLVAHCFAWILLLGWTLHFAAFVSYLWSAIEHEFFGRSASRHCSGKCTHKKKEKKLQKVTKKKKAAPVTQRQAKTKKIIAAKKNAKSTSAKKTPSARVATGKKSDDLTEIEGIGPKIATVLKEHKITTFAALARKEVRDIQKILDANELKRHNASSWSKQAVLARDEKWPALKELQNTLHGGRKKK